MKTNQFGGDNDNYREFLRGFAETAKLTNQGAEEQWAGFSRQLSPSELYHVQNGGFTSGLAEGERFLKLYQ